MISGTLRPFDKRIVEPKFFYMSLQERFPFRETLFLSFLKPLDLASRILLCYSLGMDAAIFLDRDGVIIENRDQYVRCWEDVAFIPAAIDALCSIRDTPFRIVLVTNQSAVGRGLITLEAALEINRRVIDHIQAMGGRIDGTWMCPHAPEANCSCRKPKPGLLLQAASAMNLDLSRSFMVGDALSDLQAGWAAGVREAILVRTGRGNHQSQLPQVAELPPFHTFDNLAEALVHICSQVSCT